MVKAGSCEPKKSWPLGCMCLRLTLLKPQCQLSMLLFPNASSYGIEFGVALLVSPIRGKAAPLVKPVHQSIVRPFSISSESFCCFEHRTTVVVALHSNGMLRSAWSNFSDAALLRLICDHCHIVSKPWCGGWTHHLNISLTTNYHLRISQGTWLSIVCICFSEFPSQRQCLRT